MKRQITILGFFYMVFGFGQLVDLNFADSLYTSGNYTKAINAYATLGSQKAGMQIARAYNAIGNYDKAIAQYQAVLEKDAKQQLAAFELGKLLLKTNKMVAAQELFESLSISYPSNPEYHYQLGEAIRARDDMDKSIPFYKKAITVDSTHLRSLFQLSKYYLVKRETDSVLTYTTQGLSFYPADVALINLKALAFFNNAQYRKAIPLFEQLRTLGERKTYLFMKLGFAYFSIWEFEKAKEMYKVAIEMENDNSDAHYELGHVYLKDRQLDSARIFVKKAVALQKPYLMEEYQTLAVIERQKENLNGAFEYYTLAHKEEPESPRLYWQVCVLYDQLHKDPSKKLSYYERFVELYGTEQRYMSEMVQKRISELKEQIHYTKEATD